MKRHASFGRQFRSHVEDLWRRSSRHAKFMRVVVVVVAGVGALGAGRWLLRGDDFRIRVDLPKVGGAKEIDVRAKIVHKDQEWGTVTQRAGESTERYVVTVELNRNGRKSLRRGDVLYIANDRANMHVFPLGDDADVAPLPRDATLVGYEDYEAARTRAGNP